MQKSISINVESKSGTVAWTTEQLQKMELKMSTRNGYLSIAHTAPWEKNNGKDKDGKLIWKTLMVVQSEMNAYQDGYFGMMCYNYNDRVWVNYPVERQETWGVFKYLTKAAFTLVDKFIDSVADEFIAFLDADGEGEDSVDISITIKSKKDA